MRIKPTPQHVITRGDNAPAIRYQLPLAAIDLTGATVALHAVDGEGAAVALTGSAAVESVAEHTIRFDWGNGDTETLAQRPGPYACEFQVTFTTGETRTFPSRTKIDLIVRPELG